MPHRCPSRMRAPCFHRPNCLAFSSSVGARCGRRGAVIQLMFESLLLQRGATIVVVTMGQQKPYLLVTMSVDQIIFRSDITPTV